jgi:hypothetical protein
VSYEYGNGFVFRTINANGKEESKRVPSKSKIKAAVSFKSSRTKEPIQL